MRYQEVASFTIIGLDKISAPSFGNLPESLSILAALEISTSSTILKTFYSEALLM